MPSNSHPARSDTDLSHRQKVQQQQPFSQDDAGSFSSSSNASTARERLASFASHLDPESHTEFDYVIVGGGTAGAVIANRLTEDRSVSVAVIEGGPSDVGDDRVLDLKRWLEMLGSELDYDYPTVEQPRGNSHIRHSRARVLGGCSSHNTLISFRPLNDDLDNWANYYGCPSWAANRIQPYGDRLKMNIVPVSHQDRNHVARDWVQACSQTTGAPIMEDMNSQIVHRGGFEKAVGFFNIAYNPYDGNRSSASVAYLHPIMPHGPHRRHNLHLFLETWASGLEYDNQTDQRGPRVCGVHVTTKHGLKKTLRAKREVILCAGTVDTPRLMLLSGLGPRADLEKLGIPCRVDIPGVGENLLDHPESIIMWETRETPKETVMTSDAGLFLRILPTSAEPVPHAGPDLMFHIYQIPFDENTRRLGYPTPKHAICMTPNICRSQARGKLSLASANPLDKPLLDFKYFQDPNRYDEKILVEGIKLARKIASQSPFQQHLVREIAPGSHIQTDEQISQYARSVAHTVYHPAGTCRMGTPPATATQPNSIEKNNLVVVDEKTLRVVGVRGLRICDASVLPTLPSFNPMLTVLMIAEHCSELIRNDAWVNGKRRSVSDYRTL